ncbi:hypothetical protein MFLAVUS_004290 [Mucor flavus]|uniref:HCP-like protein n=1 Tax=Mucor flavus TaxID=439312 RepID=A0ABP9YVJ2_9FUNG
MLKRFQLLFTKQEDGKLYNNQNESVQSWNTFTKPQSSYSQESIIQQQQQVDQHVQAGIEHHELGQLEKATHYFRLAAKQECPIGMFLYGISLRHGWGCKLNTCLAFQYLQTAAEYAVHDMLNGLASNGELIIAIYELGVSFQQGWGVTKNKETAFYYFEIAANLGDLDAMNDLAFCYTHGHGVKKNIFKAAQYYRMASKQGNVQIGNSWIWKDKYNIVDEPGWDKKLCIK